MFSLSDVETNWTLILKYAYIWHLQNPAVNVLTTAIFNNHHGPWAEGGDLTFQKSSLSLVFLAKRRIILDINFNNSSLNFY